MRVSDKEMAPAVLVAPRSPAHKEKRLWATRTGRISPSVEDRYDHDVDELLS